MALRISGFVLGLLLIYVGVESRLTLTPPRLEEDVSDSDTDEKWKEEANEEQEEIFYKKTDLLEKIENSMIPDESVEYRKHDIGPTVRACFFGNRKLPCAVVASVREMVATIDFLAHLTDTGDSCRKDWLFRRT